MSHFRFIPLAAALTLAGTLMACGTSPRMPMGNAAASSMATPEAMIKMDDQMKSMRAMHDKMMAAKTPEERSKMMPEHMKSMQAGMAMMKGMPGMGDMKGMPAMSGDMDAHHKMMAKHMEMMQTMMSMMQQEMMTMPAK